MAFYKSKNPTLGVDTFTSVSRSVEETETMTISGTVNKTVLLGLLVFASAGITWNRFYSTMDFGSVQGFVMGGAVIGLVLGIVIAFKKTTAPYLAPVYAVAEGLMLGGISAFMEMTYPGIVLQAVSLTFGVLFGLLALYKMKVIQATENFKLIVASATMGIGFCYLISFIGRFVGFEMPLIHDSGTFGIVFSLIVVAVAALNLVMDFDFIEEGEKVGAPKYMEWYGAFGLMVTLIWLYIEILRLLSKLRRN
ncbi:Bax inhibitor-1/YccA family protein [Reichenbachiella versicolor]|uniref:Bax inhibitor-1/YccA family protein n=1 Tax=Reichenbachiella versicolor TaxID=1821036 RepID=UPI000D6E88C0|nr:Bax inhibitor-1/YccA family protein [Reichenbachiella versicolor]